MNLEIILVRTVLVLTAALSVGISLWGGYYLLTGLMSWRRPMDYGRHPAGTRFAVLIAARNEELVIGPLINSLLEQEYPAELYDIYVIPNNCTDNTAEIARSCGAIVYERFNKVLVGKGYALDYAFNKIKEDEGDYTAYDGYFIFDADNVIDRNYVREMNKTFDQGYRVVTSYRNSKNFDTNWITSGYSLWFCREAKYLNNPRMILKTSCAVSGLSLIHI